MKNRETILNWSALGRKILWGATGAFVTFVGAAAIYDGASEGWWAVGIGFVGLIISHKITIWYTVGERL